MEVNFQMKRRDFLHQIGVTCLAVFGLGITSKGQTKPNIPEATVDEDFYTLHWEIGDFVHRKITFGSRIKLDNVNVNMEIEDVYDKIAADLTKTAREWRKWRKNIGQNWKNQN